MHSLKQKSIVEISLRIWGDNLNPLSVTKDLQTNPTRSHFKDDIKLSPKGKQRVMKSGYWELDSKDIIESNVLEKHINCLVQVLRKSKKELRLFSGFEGACISFVLGVTEDSNTIEFKLDSETIKEIASFELEVTFVII